MPGDEITKFGLGIFTDYNGTDWNNDGDIGSASDQFIERRNSGSEPVDVSDWLLDDVAGGGSAPCRLAWNTTVEPGEHIVIFRESSRIELDYWDGDTATLSDASGSVIDTLSYAAEDSWWDTSYVKAANGTVTKVDPPTPGWSGEATYPMAQNMVRCYGMNDNVHDGAYVLKGRIVTMTGEANVYNEGHVLVQDGMIEAVWEDSVPNDVQLTNVPVIETNGTIYPGLLDLHNHLHYNQVPLWDMTPHLSENNRNQWGGYNNRYDGRTTLTTAKKSPSQRCSSTRPLLEHGNASHEIHRNEVPRRWCNLAQGGPSNPDESQGCWRALRTTIWARRTTPR